MFVITYGALANPEMIEQLAGLARIFAGDHVGLAQDAKGAESNILKIADWRRYEIEIAGQLVRLRS